MAFSAAATKDGVGGFVEPAGGLIWRALGGRAAGEDATRGFLEALELLHVGARIF